MSAATLIVIARILHIVAGVIWAGFVIVFGFMLVTPPSGMSGGQARRVRKSIMDRGGLLVAPAVLVTLLSGAYLYATVHAAVHTRTEMMLGAGALSATLALFVGAIGIGPPLRRLATLDALGAPSPSDAGQIAALDRRVVVSGRVVAVLLLVSSIAMAAANLV
jgi:uncharacterized membrane protein